MTAPNPLIELAERVSALTEACRETDLAIMQAISGHPWRWADSRTFEPQTVITWDEYRADAPGNPFYTLEEFTASLDAAMTLCPELKEIDRPLTIKLAVSESGKLFWATVSNWKWGDLKSPACKTWPIALSSVLLRARAASEAIPHGR